VLSNSASLWRGVFEPNTTLQGTGTVGKAEFSTGAIISPGSNSTYPASVGVFNFGDTSTGTTTLAGIIYNVDIHHDAANNLYSDRLDITGNAVFSGTNTINITGAWWDQHSAEYTILTATGSNGVTNGGSAWTNTTFTLNGVTPDPHRLITLESRSGGHDLVLKMIDAYYALYWNGAVAAGNWTSLWESGAPSNWIRAANIADAGQPTAYAFKNGDIVIFSDATKVAGAGKTLNIAAAGVEPNTLIVDGVGSIFTFNGGPITVQSYQEEANDYFDEYTGMSSIPVEVFVQNQAKATFNVVLDAPKMNVTGDAVAILGDVSTASFTILEINLGNASSKGTLRFNRVTNNATFSGVITGAGDVEKTGAGATVTLSGVNSYTGKTTVNGGTLLVSGGLGGATREYAGAITLTGSDASSWVEFSGVDGSRTQHLSGRLAGVVGSEFRVMDGRTVEISGSQDNTPTVAPRTGYYNEYQGNLVVSGVKEGVGAHLIISGRLNVTQEAFDQNLPPNMARTYTHSEYSGNMTVNNGGTLEFTYNRDWTLTTGTLTGSPTDRGTFKVNTGMPFYFMGSGAGYGGHTEVTGGSAFHLPAGGQYGTADANNSGNFTVTGGGALLGGGAPGLGSTPTNLYAASLTMSSGTILGALPGGFRVNVANAASVHLSSGMTLRIILAAEMELPTGTYVEGTVGPGATRAPASGSGSAALSFANASGVVFSGGAGVGVSLPVPLNLVVGGSILVKGPDLYQYVLVDGLDTTSLINSFGVATPEAAVTAIFGSNEITILGAQFRVGFSENKLILTQTSFSSTIPEPSTYGLLGGLGVLGFAFWRRRKKAKK
jgi:autotransporter-associated beta strand protein